MLKIKYYKDLNHNYLIISRMVKEAANYQHKMITENRMKHLLPCKIRYVDESSNFYYEISSRQSLRSMFEKREIGHEQLLCLFESIKAAVEELDAFLLDSRCLILHPDYIFGEPETEEYFFLYYPYYIEEKEDEMTGMSLTEFLVDRIDHEQEEAVDAAYKIYEMAQDDRFILTEILKLLDSSVTGFVEKTERTVNVVNDAAVTEEAEADIWNRGRREEGRDGGTDLWRDMEEDTEDSGVEEDEEAGHTGILNYFHIAGILAVLGMIAAVGVWSIGYFYELSYREKLLSMAGTGMLVLLSALLLLYFMLHFIKERAGAAGQITAVGRTGAERWEEKRSKEGIQDKKLRGKKQQEENSSGAGRNKDIQQERLFMQEEEYIRAAASSGSYQYSQKIQEAAGGTEQEEYGNTVFLETALCKKEDKLYGISKGNKHHIDLGRLPCTIGKMAGSVDVVIKDHSISRIHARFTKEEEGIYMTDMNSTNGTFKNGLRLDPNESVLIEPGDELRFGSLTFCYR